MVTFVKVASEHEVKERHYTERPMSLRPYAVLALLQHETLPPRRSFTPRTQ